MVMCDVCCEEGEEDAGGKKKEEREQEVSKAEELGEGGESPPATPKAPGTPKSTAKPSDQKDGTLDERPKTSGEADTGTTILLYPCILCKWKLTCLTCKYGDMFLFKYFFVTRAVKLEICSHGLKYGLTKVD